MSDPESKIEVWKRIAKQHYDRLGPCPFFGDKGMPGGHIYGADDTDVHCQLCGLPRQYTQGENDQ